MDQAGLDALVQFGQQMCVFFSAPGPCRILSSVVLCRLMDKVIPRISNVCGGGSLTDRVSRHTALYDWPPLPVVLRLLPNLWRRGRPA